jgi:hypothetical protein
VAQKASRVRSAVGLAAHLGRGLQRVTTDVAAGRARSLPQTIAALDARFLSRLMGATVTSVSVIGGDAGTSSRARLALGGDGVPASVFVKMPATTVATRLMGEVGRLARTETHFYAELAPQLSGVPNCHGSAFDPLTGRFVLVLEDLAVDDCEFPDTLHPLTPDQAGQVVELLARLHARFWERAPRWTYTPSGDSTTLIVGPMAKLSARRLAARTDIPVGNGRYLLDNNLAATRLVDRPPHTVMHGDAHPGNVYFRRGRAGLLDWQAVRRGHPGRELAYTLITSMTTTDRLDHQRDLLDVYRDALAAGGGPALNRDDLWDRYRLGAQYPFIATLIVAGAGGMQAENIAIEGLRRSAAALEDLDTASVLKASL